MAYLPMLAEEESRAALLDMLSKGWYSLIIVLSFFLHHVLFRRTL